MNTGHFIDGKHVRGRFRPHGGRVPTLDGSVRAKVALATRASELDAAVAWQAAQPAWAACHQPAAPRRAVEFLELVARDNDGKLAELLYEHGEPFPTPKGDVQPRCRGDPSSCWACRI